MTNYRYALPTLVNVCRGRTVAVVGSVARSRVFQAVWKDYRRIRAKIANADFKIRAYIF